MVEITAAIGPVPSIFFSMLDPTQFSFENLQVTGNHKYRLKPIFRVNPTFWVNQI